MAVIGKVSGIIAIKNMLENMKSSGQILEWELPYEQLLTRLTAAIFFVTPSTTTNIDEIVNQLSSYQASYTKNMDKKLSFLQYKIQLKRETADEESVKVGNCV